SASPPRPARRSAASFMADGSRPVTTTDTPASASISAIPRPMPTRPPVMSATLPWNHSRSMSKGERWTCPLPPCGGGLGRGVSTLQAQASELIGGDQVMQIDCVDGSPGHLDAGLEGTADRLGRVNDHLGAHDVVGLGWIERVAL